MIFNLLLAVLLFIAPCSAFKPTAFVAPTSIVATATTGFIGAYPTATAFVNTRLALERREELKSIAKSEDTKAPSVVLYMLQPIRSLFQFFQSSKPAESSIVEVLPAVSVPTLPTPTASVPADIPTTAVPCAKTPREILPAAATAKFAAYKPTRSSIVYCLTFVLMSLTLLVAALLLILQQRRRAQRHMATVPVFRSGQLVASKREYRRAQPLDRGLRVHCISPVAIIKSDEIIKSPTELTDQPSGANEPLKPALPSPVEVEHETPKVTVVEPEKPANKPEGTRRGFRITPLRIVSTPKRTVTPPGEYRITPLRIVRPPKRTVTPASEIETN